MIRRIVDFSLDNRFLVIVLWLLVGLGGIYALADLPIDAVPDVTNVQVQVLTNSPGLAPEEIEKFVTFPVETAMSGLPKVEEIRSISRFGLSAVTVVFEEDADIFWARQLIGERLTEAREAIPEGYGTPEIAPLSTGLGEVYQFEVRGPGRSPMELRSILEGYISPQLKSVPGVVEINTFGGELRTYQLELDPALLQSHRLSLRDVIEALQRSNGSAGGAYIERHREQLLVRGDGLIATLDDLGDTVIANGDDGTPILARHLGRVSFAPAVRHGAVTRDGKETFATHGVFTYDREDRLYKLFWFDSLGYYPPSPASGNWQGQALVLVRGSLRGNARHVYEMIDDNSYSMKIQFSPDSEGWNDVLTGVYRRAN